MEGGCCINFPQWSGVGLSPYLSSTAPHGRHSAVLSSIGVILGEASHLREKNIAVVNAGKTSKSWLAQLQPSIKLCRFTHLNHYQRLNSIWEETTVQKHGVLSANVVGRVRSNDSYHQAYSIYQVMDDGNHPTGRETFEMPGFVLHKEWHQILPTCVAKPQTQHRHEALRNLIMF